MPDRKTKTISKTTGFSSYTYRSCVVPIQARVPVSHKGI